MFEKVLQNDDQLKTLVEENNYSEAARLLFKKQIVKWPLLKNGHSTLSTTEVKTFQYPGYSIKAQFNPGRIVSSSAKVDAKSIKERKCFLCVQNLPEEQRGILYRDKSIILCNPFPIFPEHFTIPDKEHVPQLIKGNLGKMLSLSKDLAGYYTVLYNGPKCGASAPDHFHLQAGSKFFMPLDNDFHQVKNEYGDFILDEENLSVAAVDDGLRRFISIESVDDKEIENIFNVFYGIYNSISPAEPEPMMNILSFYEKEYGWRVLIFPRDKHRSSHYFAEDDNNVLLSVASVDLGGVCILPLEKDFKKINKEILKEIFDEIIIAEEKFRLVKEELRKKL